jgi:peptidoglycan/LPS O-acetylase OafA/YrhL
MAGGGGRIARVDALRGLAALGVFVFHASNLLQFPKRVMPPFDFAGRHWDAIPSPFSLGATGVNLFFVISGFCLALQPLRRGAASVRLPRYYRDRAARIYPAYLVALLFSVAAVTWLGTPWRAAELGTFMLFLQGFVQPWVFSFNGALWSMSSEVQFYLAFPVLYVLLARHGARRFLAGAALAGLAWRAAAATSPGADLAAGGITQAAFLMNLLPGRLLEFALGMAVASAFGSEPAGLGRLARRMLLPMAILGFGLRGFGPNWLGDPAISLLFATVLAVAITAPEAMPDDNPAARFGRASYSFFLLHFPVLSLLVAGLGGAQAMTVAGPYTGLAVLAGIGVLSSLALSTALYLGVELPGWRLLRGKTPAGAPVPASDP